MEYRTFEALGIGKALVEGLGQAGIEQPTAIQQAVIPEILSGKDIVGRSETGSGKTLAYLLPLFQKIDTGLRSTQVIVLTPTHELAAQVQREAEQLAVTSGMAVRSALVIGSASMTRQIEKLKEKPQIVIGSAGRILDLIQKRKIAAHTVKTIVLDEGDRLLDKRNCDGVKAVIKTTLRDRQIVILSATIPNEMKGIAKEILHQDIQWIAVEGSALPESISHGYVVAEKREKFIVLRKILAGEQPEKAIVFLNNPENIAVTVDKLCYHGLQADGIYGGAYKTERQNALEHFRQGKINILVASDIGARGLDIAGVTHVIHLDVPEIPEQYLHRAGRTGRKGLSGKSIVIVTPFETKWIRSYEKTWGVVFQQQAMSYGKLVNSSEKERKKVYSEPKKEKKGVKKEKISEKKETYSEKYHKKEKIQTEGFLAKKKKEKIEKLEKRNKK